MPEQFCSVLLHARERRCRRFEAEEELLGISHAEIGAYLLGLWGIDNRVVEAVAHHHHPKRIPHTLFENPETVLDSSVAVYLADLLAHELEEHPHDAQETQIYESDRACLEALRVAQSFPEFRKRALGHSTQAK